MRDDEAPAGAGVGRPMPNPGPSPKRRGPKPLADILGELFASRGYGRLRAQAELEDAWNAAVGEPACRQTRLGEVRRGVLNVTVAHPALLEELAAFQKPTLLAALRQNAPGTTIHDIRFRVGPVDDPPTPPPAPAPEARPGGPGPRSRGTGPGPDRPRSRPRPQPRRGPRRDPDPERP